MLKKSLALKTFAAPQLPGVLKKATSHTSHPFEQEKPRNTDSTRDDSDDQTHQTPADTRSHPLEYSTRTKPRSFFIRAHGGAGSKQFWNLLLFLHVIVLQVWNFWNGESPLAPPLSHSLPRCFGGPSALIDIGSERLLRTQRF